MKDFFVVFIALLIVLVFIPFFVVTIMSKTIDNDSYGDTEIVEEY